MIVSRQKQIAGRLREILKIELDFTGIVSIGTLLIRLILFKQKWTRVTQDVIVGLIFLIWVGKSLMKWMLPVSLMPAGAATTKMRVPMVH